jgi:hypothetical protein
METEEIRALLSKFQAGYTARDPQRLDECMELFIAGAELEVIGTNAVAPGGGEWCLGPAAVRTLVANDWKYWGDVVFDVADAHIFVKGDVGWLATTGTVTATIPVADRYNEYLKYVQGVLADSEKSEQAKTLDIVRSGNGVVLELPLSDTFVWPLRLTAVAVREAGVWKFHQMQFSFATTSTPDVRNV